MGQIRGPFPLPQTSPQITGTVGVLELTGGGIYLLPPGNFICTTGPQTALQWWDPMGMTWRGFHQHQAALAWGSDGANYRFINMSGIVSAVNITAPGSGGQNGIGPIETLTTLTFPAPATPAIPGSQAIGYAIIGGTVPAPTIVQGGSRFQTVPVVCCDPPPPGGIQATFTCTLDQTGAIATVSVVNPGAGYKSIPQFYVIPQPVLYQGSVPWPPTTHFHGHDYDLWNRRPWPAQGLIHSKNVWPGTMYQSNIDDIHGALIVGNPLGGSGTLTGAVLSYNGAGYTAAPTPTLTGGPLTGATVTATPSLSVVPSGSPPVVALGGTSTVGEIVTVPSSTGNPATLVAVDTAGNFSVVNAGSGIAPGAVASNGTTVPATALGGANDVSYLQWKVIP